MNPFCLSDMTDVPVVAAVIPAMFALLRRLLSALAGAGSRFD